jgi:hypothetical protein
VEGNCGLLFEEPAVFSIVRANAITTGAWRSDVAPTVVWAGKNAQCASSGDAGGAAASRRHRPREVSQGAALPNSTAIHR